MQERSTKDLEKELSACEEISEFLTQNQEHMHSASVSERLRCYLEEKSLSRSEVIARCGLNDIYAHQILSGKRRPSRDNRRSGAGSAAGLRLCGAVRQESSGQHHSVCPVSGHEPAQAQ